MPTFGLLFILAAVFIGREVMVGRAKETPIDIKDLFVGFLNADMTSVQSVLARRGSNTGAAGDTGSGTAVDGSAVTVSPASSSSSQSGMQLAREVITLGSAASGYVSGGVGPKGYDCSGLVWKACYELGLYVGPRFTTYTFPAAAAKFCKKVANPAVGDICLWYAHGHMGVVVGPDMYYSAHSPDKGINSATISGDSSYFGSQPTYWRPN